MNIDTAKDIVLYFSNPVVIRKRLFEDALSSAKLGKVLYILCDEINELPQLSQDTSLLNKHYMRMISFLYAKSLQSLLESISSLPDWKNVPSTIILDNLTDYCGKEKVQNACGIIAFLLDTAKTCSCIVKVSCKLRIGINEAVGEDYCNVLKELYSY